MGWGAGGCQNTLCPSARTCRRTPSPKQTHPSDVTQAALGFPTPGPLLSRILPPRPPPAFPIPTLLPSLPHNSSQPAIKGNSRN